MLHFDLKSVLMKDSLLSPWSSSSTKVHKTMGASEVLTDPSSLYDVGNYYLSDTETVLTVRNALASVQNVSLLLLLSCVLIV